ncbi:MAG: hypothetical protein Q9217_000135 [Psora testacea]
MRHGETVDNIAGIYAGVKDSTLTTHGHLQAERLGQYFARRNVRFTHVFSSDLQRAYKTASAICSAQPTSSDEDIPKKLEIRPLAVLREQDFGFYEGKPFYTRPRDSSQSGMDDRRFQHHDDPDFIDVESKQSMAARMDQYLQDHLLPTLKEDNKEREATVAIVSHGIILAHLWRSFLRRFPKNSVVLSPGLSVGTGGVTPLEFLGGWSNTGYFELQVSKDSNTVPNRPASSSEPSPALAGQISCVSLLDHKMVIQAVNGREHLKGLKRTRGVGSSEFDEGQKKIESFFKKRRGDE